MTQSEHLFAGVAEGAMADVVQKCCGVQQPSINLQLIVLVQQLGEGAPGQMKHPDGMGEAAGFRAVKREEGRP